MAQVKLTKNELRLQQYKLNQLQKYLPTLQLKKAMLQTEVNHAKIEIASLIQQMDMQNTTVEGYCCLFTDNFGVPAHDLAKIEKVDKLYENIAGVEIPIYQKIDFKEPYYSLFETPPWLEGLMKGLRKLVELKTQITVAEEKLQALQKELREVSIRVNLFEKVMIPRALENIKKIKVFLGDQQLAAVCQAKVAKSKKEASKEAMACV